MFCVGLRPLSRRCRRSWIGSFGVVLLGAVMVAGLLLPTTPAQADGMTWTSRSAARDLKWNSVAYGQDGSGNPLWVAVAESGTGDRVMTSPDGIAWTDRSSALDNAWFSVAHGQDGSGNPLWVAVAASGSGARVMTSPDGITWTARPSAGDDRSWRSVAYGNGIWVAVANSGIGNRVMTSPDGIIWTNQVSAADSAWLSVAYGQDGSGNPLWVAVATGGSGDRVMTSPDGVTWTGATAAANMWRSVAYGQDGSGNGLWVAVDLGFSGTGDRVMTSPDGTNWTSRTAAAAVAWFSVAYGDGLWVAVANAGDGSAVMTSRDGVEWTLQDSANPPWRSVAYGNGTWVAVAFSGTDRVMTSSGVAVAGQPVAEAVAAVPPSVSCVPSVPVAGGPVTCTVSGGDAGIDILWRAAYNPVIAEAGVTLDDSGSGEFSFVVPAAALGEDLTVELVEWAAPLSLGVVAGSVPASVPSGEGPVPVWTILLAALVGVGLMRGAFAKD